MKKEDKCVCMSVFMFVVCLTVVMRTLLKLFTVYVGTFTFLGHLLGP